MTDLHLIALLKKHGWKLHTRSTLRNWTKERLIDEIECLENNWGVSLEREEISFEYKKKLVEENEQLKAQIEKIGDFIQAGDLCSICKFENKCNPNECFNQNIRVYTKWELAE